MAVSLLARKMLASLCLRVLHFCYYLAVSLSNFWKTFDLRKPQHLTAERTKLPSHLALLLVVGEDIDAEEIEDSLVECVLRGVTWCQAVGIRQLTVYDSQGAVSNCSQNIRMRLSADKPPCEDDTESEMEYPLTPPLSDTSESRPLSPDYDDRLGMITMQVSELQAPKQVTQAWQTKECSQAPKAKKQDHPCRASNSQSCVATIIQTSYSFGSSLICPDTKANSTQDKR